MTTSFWSWLFNVVLFPLSEEERDLLERFYNAESMTDKNIRPEELPALKKLIRRGFVRVTKEVKA